MNTFLRFEDPRFLLLGETVQVFYELHSETSVTPYVTTQFKIQDDFIYLFFFLFSATEFIGHLLQWNSWLQFQKAKLILLTNTELYAHRSDIFRSKETVAKEFCLQYWTSWSFFQFWTVWIYWLISIIFSSYSRTMKTTTVPLRTPKKSCNASRVRFFT
jgi:hypothetical protein